jgi:hypothetical protein
MRTSGPNEPHGGSRTSAGVTEDDDDEGDNNVVEEEKVETGDAAGDDKLS